MNNIVDFSDRRSVCFEFSDRGSIHCTVVVWVRPKRMRLLLSHLEGWVQMTDRSDTQIKKFLRGGCGMFAMEKGRRVGEEMFQWSILHHDSGKICNAAIKSEVDLAKRS